MVTWTRDQNRYGNHIIHAPVNKFNNTKALKSPEVGKVIRQSWCFEWDAETKSHIKNIENAEKMKKQEG